MRATHLQLALLPFLAASTLATAEAAERHFTFGYDQPHTTAYGYAADVFAAKLKELSKGEMIIDQFPGAQLGQEPQMLQKVRTGISILSSPPAPTRRPSRPRLACCRSISSSMARIT